MTLGENKANYIKRRGKIGPHPVSKENTMKAKCSDSNLRLYICYPRIYSGKVSPRVLIYVKSNIWTVDLIFHFPLDSLHIVDITAVS